MLAAGVLIWRGDGRLLMVSTHHRDSLILPGGLVETGESPGAAARREVHEELGLEVEVGPLLAVQHVPVPGEELSSVQFVFDSKTVEHIPRLVLQPEEILDAHWLSTAEAAERSSTAGRARLLAALTSRRTGALPLLEV